MRLIFAVAAWVVFFAGCSSTQYYYTPASGQAGGKESTEAITNDPLGPHSGTVRVQSLGMTKLKLKGGSEEIPALHMRLAVSNQTSNQTWTMNAQDQSVSFANHGSVSPVAVNSDHDGLPQMQIAPGEIRAIELFFPLPDPKLEAKDIPEFDMHWTFSTGTSKVSQTVAFNRQTVPEAVTEAYPAYGYYMGAGPYWWYGPGPYPYHYYYYGGYGSVRR